MKKFLLLVGTKRETYRVIRFREELKKMNMESERLFVGRGSLIEAEDISKNCRSKSYEGIFAIGNSTRKDYAIRNLICYNRYLKIWPDKEYLFLSDKFNEGIFLSSVGIKVPKTYLLTDLEDDFLENLRSEMEFPWVIKTVKGSGGSAVGLVNNKVEILDFVDKSLGSKMNGKKNIIIQEFIPEAKGVDYRVLCLRDEIIGGMKRESQSNDFRANVSLGGKGTCFEVPDELANICRKIMKEGNIFYAGLDFIKKGDDWLTIEINTSANFEGFEKATGINVAKKIISELIKK